MLTNEGALLGTPDYLVPEQAREPRRVDIRADIYSLGCTLYHALAGQPPFKDDKLVRQILRHATQEPESLRRHGVPGGLEQVVLTMIAKDHTQRHQTGIRPRPTPFRVRRVEGVWPLPGMPEKAPGPWW